MNSARRIGYLSALGLALVGFIYVGVVIVGILEAGLDEPIKDPILGVMEAITLVSALLVIILMASIYVTTAQEHKVYGIIALSFGVIMAGLTSAVHFVALTTGRQTDFTVLVWPSIVEY